MNDQREAGAATRAPRISGTETLSRSRVARRAGAGVLAAGFAIAVLLGMDRWTVSSTVPRLTDVPSVSRYAEAVRAAGIDSPFALASASVDRLSSQPDLTLDRSIMLTETAKLVTLRGLGVAHATRLRELGIFTQCRLALVDPASLWSAYHERAITFDPPTTTPPVRPTPAEVRVWVGAATRACVQEMRGEE